MNPGLSRMMIQINKLGLTTKLQTFPPGLKDSLVSFFASEALAGNGQTPVSLADARRSIELLTAAYWSVKTGEIVQLPLSSDHPFYSGWIETMKQEFGKTQS